MSSQTVDKDRPTWAEYIQSITDGATGAEVCRRTGILQGTWSRWKSGKITHPSVEEIEKLVRVYGTNLSDAMRSAGYGIPDRSLNEARGLSGFTASELAEELVRRVAREGKPVIDIQNAADHFATKYTIGDE